MKNIVLYDLQRKKSTDLMPTRTDGPETRGREKPERDLGHLRSRFGRDRLRTCHHLYIARSLPLGRADQLQMSIPRTALLGPFEHRIQ